MVVIDVSIVNVALPAIRHALHYSPSGLQWVVNAYTLTFAGLLMLGGRAGDLVGLRRLFLGGLGVFTLASLAGGLAQDAAWLSTARAFQGIGGAALAPASLSIVTTTFSEGEARNRALGIWSAIVGAAGAIGVLAGGILTSELSWRWILIVNVPIGVVGLLAGRRYLPHADRDHSARLDLPGAMSLTSGLVLVVYAVVQTSTHPWGSSPTIATLLLAALLLAVFVIIERRSTAPLIPFGVLRARALLGANLVQLAVGAAFFSFLYFRSLYMQGVLGYSPLRTGLAFVPMGLAITIGARSSSRLTTPVGPRITVITGLTATLGGLLWMSQTTDHSTYRGGILIPGVLVSLGLGLVLPQLAAAATSGVSSRQAGLASGLLNTSRQIGGSIGLAILATLATSRINVLSAGHLATPTSYALSAGYDRAFFIAAAFAAAAIPASVMLPGRGTS